MDFVRYLEYAEYKELSGKASEEEFDRVLRKAQRWVDYFTFGRIKSLTRIPDEVKEVVADYVDRILVLESQREGGDVVSSYSNGVETLTYKLKTEEETKKEFYNIAQNWLPNYLINRSVNFNVEQYLQSESNNS